MNKSKRVDWIDMIKFLCMVFVMASHVGNHNIAPILRAFYTPFFLSGFLFASGYTYLHREGFGNHVKKKALQLLIAWFTFSMLTRLLGQIRHFGITSFLEDMKWNFLQIRGLDDGMWFVAALFVAYVPFYFFVRVYEKEKEEKSAPYLKYLIISLVLLLVYYLYITFVPDTWFPWGCNRLPWHIEYIPFAMGCMCLGYLVKERYENILDRIGENTVRRILYYAIYMVLVFVPYGLLPEAQGLLYCLYQTLLTIAGILFISIVSKQVRTNRLFRFVGQNTLIYLGLQGKVIFVIETVLKKVSPSAFATVTAHPVASIVYSLIMGVMLCLILIIPAIIINRYLPFMIGKRRKKS